MNDRIREVWIKAAREDSDPDNWDTQEQFIERFAKLIVRECAEMGDNFDGQPSGNAVRKYLTAGDAIREYFGVE